VICINYFYFSISFRRLKIEYRFAERSITLFSLASLYGFQIQFFDVYIKYFGSTYCKISCSRRRMEKIA
jgi:hypothetical protein